MADIDYKQGDLSRFEIINKLIKKNGYKSYLEIGVANPENNFLKIHCDNKKAVDPNPEKLVEGVVVDTSDSFFSTNTDMFDIVFVDGLHEDAQVTRDIQNSLRFLNPGGAILVHDCFPTQEKATSENPSWLLPISDPNHSYAWLGTAYKGWIKLRATREDLEMHVIATDCGCGFIKRGKQVLVDAPEDITWDYYSNNYKEALNLISVDEFLEKEELV